MASWRAWLERLIVVLAAALLFEVGYLWRMHGEGDPPAPWIIGLGATDAATDLSPAAPPVIARASPGQEPREVRHRLDGGAAAAARVRPSRRPPPPPLDVGECVRSGDPLGCLPAR